MSSVERSNVRSELKNPLLSRKRIERGNASARLDRDASSLVRHVIGIPFRQERPPPPPQISRFFDVAQDVSPLLVRRVFAQLSSRNSDQVSKSMCVYFMLRY